MRLNKLLQKDYTLSSLYYQIKLPLDVEILIPADDPVRLLSTFVEGMELSDLYQTYGRIKKNQATPRQLPFLLLLEEEEADMSESGKKSFLMGALVSMQQRKMTFIKSFLAICLKKIFPNRLRTLLMRSEQRD